MGVDLFFVLSGYLISLQLFREYTTGRVPSVKRFYLNRSLRILPAYLVTVAIYLTFPTWRETPAIQPAWQFWTFSENLFIDYSIDRAFSHVWSLCVEEHFYLIFPWVVAVLMWRPSVKSALLVSAVIFLGGIALRSFIWHSHFAHPLDAASQTTRPGFRYFELIYYPTYTRLDGLLAGVSLAAIRSFRPIWWERLTHRRWLPLALGVGGSVLTGWIFRDRYSYWPTALDYPLLSCSLAMFVAAAATLPERFTTWRIPGVTALATLAYSLYLTHKLLFTAVNQRLAPHLIGNGPALLLSYFVAALVGALALHLAVERPFLRWRDRLLASTADRASPAAIPTSVAEARS